ncbi:NADH-quinone oxidoreductase subunit NuoF [Thioalkalivibrio sp.]|uniref:NADH-quinone oxidoreductase subunit NuoF n=1 Tax=Thioalkalivibrio sp. TaxID=2093813 RepID=UPI0012D4CD56|nr:NADH-quinone oxidoreductase subunit NuoF [Thioalkalivibrio sp.]TVP82594.1 MAG: NADH-quinone oxidoreductase subunit NuoF [Thioalkalivibrio sp.]
MTGRKVLMDFEVTPTSHSLDDYRARGGYEALEKALRTMKPREVTQEIVDSGLQGRGGAAFPAGRKWQGIDPDDGQPHYLIANADEGEPGTFKDRWVLEYTPHTLLESMLLSCYALGVRHCFVYIRGEYDLPWRRLDAAVEEAYAAGYFGENILGSDFSCDLFVFRGAGAYVCGEASSLLGSIEGTRAFPRNRPPRMTVRGLYQAPTVVNNVETLATIAWIIRNGASAFREVGTEKSPGTRLISISGHIARPGVYEVELGYSWAKFLHEDCGGVLDGRPLKAVIPGGISSQVLTGKDAKVLTAGEVEGLTLDHEKLRSAGSSLGSGGMIVIAEGTCMVRLLQIMLRFYHHESCGQCTPCREGTGWMHRIIDRIVAGDGRAEDLERLNYIAGFNDGTTICGLGDAAGYAATAMLDNFRDEFDYFIENKRSKFAGNLE